MGEVFSRVCFLELLDATEDCYIKPHSHHQCCFSNERCSRWERMVVAFLYFRNCYLLFDIYKKKKQNKKTLILDFPCFHTCLLFKFILQPCKAIFFLLWLCFVHSQLMILDFFVAFFFFNFYCCILKVNITSKNTLVWLAFFCWVLASFQSPLKLTT